MGVIATFSAQRPARAAGGGILGALSLPSKPPDRASPCAMSGVQTLQSSVPIRGAADLQVRALRDRQQYDDPLGAAEALGISPAAWPLFGLVWPSGLQLADRIAQRVLKPGERILEIGCGLGLASLVGHRRGACMTASDIHPLAGPFLRENLRLNALAPMPYHPGPWTGSASGRPAEEAACGSERYDLLIGSDLLYERDEAGWLAAFIGRHAAEQAEIWIVDPDRGNRSAFHRRMADLGYGREELRLDAAEQDERAAYKGRLITYRRA